MSFAGVLVCGIAVGMFKYASFGVDPFQTLMSGLSACIPISFGTLYVIVNVFLLSVSLIFDRSRIGIATFINLFLLGYIIDGSLRVLKTLDARSQKRLDILLLVVDHFLELIDGYDARLSCIIQIRKYLVQRHLRPKKEEITDYAR